MQAEVQNQGLLGNHSCVGAWAAPVTAHTEGRSGLWPSLRPCSVLPDLPPRLPSASLALWCTHQS